MIDVDTKDGLSEAAKKGVFAAPTVIVYDANDAEIARGHNVEEISAILEPATVAAAV
jgi:ribonucleoside-triphosphate reductase